MKEYRRPGWALLLRWTVVVGIVARVSVGGASPVASDSNSRPLVPALFALRSAMDAAPDRPSECSRWQFSNLANAALRVVTDKAIPPGQQGLAVNWLTDLWRVGSHSLNAPNLESIEGTVASPAARVVAQIARLRRNWTLTHLRHWDLADEWVAALWETNDFHVQCLVIDEFLTGAVQAHAVARDAISSPHRALREKGAAALWRVVIHEWVISEESEQSFIRLLHDPDSRVVSATGMHLLMLVPWQQEYFSELLVAEIGGSLGRARTWEEARWLVMLLNELWSQSRPALPGLYAFLRASSELNPGEAGTGDVWDRRIQQASRLVLYHHGPNSVERMLNELPAVSASRSRTAGEYVLQQLSTRLLGETPDAPDATSPSEDEWRRELAIVVRWHANSAVRAEALGKLFHSPDEQARLLGIVAVWDSGRRTDTELRSIAALSNDPDAQVSAWAYQVCRGRVELDFDLGTWLAAEPRDQRGLASRLAAWLLTQGETASADEGVPQINYFLASFSRRGSDEATVRDWFSMNVILMEISRSANLSSRCAAQVARLARLPDVPTATRTLALRTLSRSGVNDARSYDVVMAGLRSNWADHRLAALECLRAGIVPPAAAPVLRDLASHDPWSDIRAAAAQELECPPANRQRQSDCRCREEHCDGIRETQLRQGGYTCRTIRPRWPMGRIVPFVFPRLMVRRPSP
jgi:hypothetical protein